MGKELTIISVFLLGLTADILWFWNTADLGVKSFVQLGLALFLLTFIVLAARKYLSKHWRLRPKFSLASILQRVRLRFRFGLWKRQTLLPRV